MVHLSDEERREVQRPLDLWDVEPREPSGAGAVVAVCLFGLVFGLGLPFAVWLYLR